MLVETKQKVERAIVVAVAFNSIRPDFEKEFEELNALCETAHLEVVGKASQNVKEENARTLIGKGKVEEIASLVKLLNADVVIIDTELTGTQLNNISECTKVKVIDRPMLILDIFANRATTNEGRLQVKLAQLKYALPRVANIEETSNKFGGGVGMRGPGETKLEVDKRKIRKAITKLEKEILKIKNSRKLQYVKRKKNSVKEVALVGYTNAGKSTLMNAITNADVYADDLLFATLDTTSRILYLGDNKKVILSDTVGFIDKLPPSFIQAFNATLEETANADLLVHVVDISDSDYEHKMEVVKKVLRDIHADKIPIITVFNKIDKVKRPFIVPLDVILISAKKGTGIKYLKEKISSMLP